MHTNVSVIRVRTSRKIKDQPIDQVTDRGNFEANSRVTRFRSMNDVDLDDFCYYCLSCLPTVVCCTQNRPHRQKSTGIVSRFLLDSHSLD